MISEMLHILGLVFIIHLWKNQCKLCHETWYPRNLMENIFLVVSVGLKQVLFSVLCSNQIWIINIEIVSVKNSNSEYQYQNQWWSNSFICFIQLALQKIIIDIYTCILPLVYTCIFRCLYLESLSDAYRNTMTRFTCKSFTN